MNLFKWLTNKTGKLPISIAQAAGITAVVGAAGFAAMSYLSSPADTNNSFIPPSAYEQNGDVVYVSQSGGGGQYEANGEVGSAFRARQSDSIRLANQQFERENQARALAEADVKPAYASDEETQLPKAYQIGAGDVGLGMGGNADKQLNSSLDMFSSLQNQFSGVGDAINKAQAQATDQQGAARGASTSTSGQTAAQLASAPRNWGQGGLTHAGSGGSGSSNTFAVQDSGKNKRDDGKDAAAAMAQMGNVMTDAQAAIKQMSEGARMRSRANFGSSDGLGIDRDARGQGARRRYGNAKSELEWIRKQSAEIAKNKTNSANEGGRPFLASAQISGGLVVSGDNVTTGQGASSSDLSSFKGGIGGVLRGVKAKLDDVQADQDERNLARQELLSWFWTVFPVVMAATLAIAILVKIAKHIPAPFNVIFWVAAGLLTLASLFLIAKLVGKVNIYRHICGGDKWSTLGYTLSGIFALGIGAGWLAGLLGKVKAGQTFTIKSITAMQWITGIAGFSGSGYGVYRMLTHKDQYLKEIADANEQSSQTQQQNEESGIEDGGNE